MLDILGLNKSFGDVAALRGCTLGVERGEMLGFLGPNGAGKTALEAIPGWHYLSAVVLTAASATGMVFVAGRIYAGGLLRFGGKVGVREAWKGASE